VGNSELMTGGEISEKSETYRTEAVVIWPAAPSADLGGAPVELVEGVAHDAHGDGGEDGRGDFADLKRP
jgi:hypothetical protein